MNAACVPSGDVTESGGVRSSGASAGRHAAPPVSHVQRRSPKPNGIDCPSAEYSNVANGRSSAEYFASAAFDSAAATRSWSKARARVRAAGSTSTNSWPPATSLRYQNRPSASHVGRTVAPATSESVL